MPPLFLLSTWFITKAAICSWITVTFGSRHASASLRSSGWAVRAGHGALQQVLRSAILQNTWSKPNKVLQISIRRSLHPYSSFFVLCVCVCVCVCVFILFKRSNARAHSGSFGSNWTIRWLRMKRIGRLWPSKERKWQSCPMPLKLRTLAYGYNKFDKKSEKIFPLLFPSLLVLLL